MCYRLEEQRKIHLEAHRKLESIQVEPSSDVINNRTTVKKPETLYSNSAKDKLLWEGLNPLTVERKYPGLMLDGDYILRPFVDPDDKTAQGMEGRPRTLEDMSHGQAEDRFYQ